MRHPQINNNEVALKRWQWIKIPLLLVGVAFLLRTPTLDQQSFWADEVQSVYFVDRPLLDTIKLVISPEHNGPLYYLLLWFWIWATGATDFAVRYFSDLCSVMTVAVVWQAARTLFNRRVAGYSGLLIAISPFAIWFGQEARTYALHMLLTTLSTLFLIRALHHNRWPYWLGYGIAFNLLAYSHYFGAFAIAAQGIVTVLVTFKEWPRLRSYLVTMLVVALPYLPIVRYALRVIPGFQLQDISKGFVSLPNMLREYGAEYVLRTSMLNVPHPLRLLVPLAFFLLLGLGYAWRYQRRSAFWVTGMLLLPTAIFYPISFKIPAFSPKYLSAAFPFFIITLALSLEGLRRWWKPLTWGGLGVMVATAGWANVRTLTQSQFQRSDWRAAAAYLEAHIEPDDAIVGFAHYATERALNRYYKGAAPVYRFKADPYAPEAYYQGWLQRDQDHHTLWLLLHQDQAMAPQNRLREAAGAMFPNITGVYPNNGNIAILGYSLRWRHETLPASALPLNARFENGLALAGYHVDADTLPATDKLFHPPSNWIHVTTYWCVWDSAPPLDFTPFVRMVDAQGGVWGGELQRPPTVFHFDPPAQWDTGAIIEAHYDVNLNPVTPPGEYRLIVGLEREDGTRVLLTNGTTEAYAYLQNIEITK